MKKLLSMALSLTLVLTLFTFNTYAKSYDFNDLVLRSIDNNMIYDYSFNHDTGRLIVRMKTNAEHIYRELRFKVVVYDYNGDCIGTYSANDYTNYLIERYQLYSGARTIKIYYYVNDELQESKKVRL
ncbi:hypothetical protein [Vallitalea maricola]|uniref:Uncharacterized protein n=1 Tax=Vallitalea maricola TaxID=3074433 RepID=A0ACB5UMM2_9FIRM|nr:hypothetical protein AN2V17_23960 [Vallitalea sp. AN17-2]